MSPTIRKNNSYRAIMLMGLLTIVGCGVWWVLRGPDQTLKSMTDEEGFVQRRSIRGITYAVRYIPARELIRQELASASPLSDEVRDSLAKAYDNTLTFTLTISGRVNDSVTADVLLSSSQNQDDYAARLSELSFNAGDNLFIRAGDTDIHPLLTHFEPQSGKANESCLIMVFPRRSGVSAAIGRDDLDLVFVDRMFGTGINHFFFKSSLFHASA